MGHVTREMVGCPHCVSLCRAVCSLGLNGASLGTQAPTLVVKSRENRPVLLPFPSPFLPSPLPHLPVWLRLIAFYVCDLVSDACSHRALSLGSRALRPCVVREFHLGLFLH